MKPRAALAVGNNHKNKHETVKLAANAASPGELADNDHADGCNNNNNNNNGNNHDTNLVSWPLLLLTANWPIKPLLAAFAWRCRKASPSVRLSVCPPVCLSLRPSGRSLDKSRAFIHQNKLVKSRPSVCCLPDAAARRQVAPRPAPDWPYKRPAGHSNCIIINSASARPRKQQQQRLFSKPNEYNDI